MRAHVRRWWLGGLVVVAITWIASSVPTSQPAPVAPAPVPASSTHDDAPFDMSREAARLREGLVRAPAPQVGFRNPFEFAGAAHLATPAAPQSRARAAQVAPAPVAQGAPEWAPPFKLGGIATPRDADAGRTAILSGRSDVFLVRQGDVVLERYVVERVDEDAVTLTDRSSGRSFTLSLAR